MYAIPSDVYDAVFGYKHYGQEAEGLLTNLSQIGITKGSWLDLACGTGLHHPVLSQRFAVSGIDINQDFVQAAVARNRTVSYLCSDMLNYVTDAKFDVVTCLFSSIAYIPDADALTDFFRSVKSVLVQSGVFMFESWLHEDQLSHLQESHFSIPTESGRIERGIRYTRSGTNKVTMHNTYDIHCSNQGLRRIEEHHDLTAFSRDVILQCLLKAGFSCHQSLSRISRYDLHGATP